jgi:hypothetical protein
VDNSLGRGYGPFVRQTAERCCCFVVVVDDDFDYYDDDYDDPVTRRLGRHPSQSRRF